MKKIGIFLLVLLLGLGLTGCADPEELNNALESYCENNPDSTVCTNPDATRDVIVANMFNRILEEFVSGANAEFCTDYFAHEGLIDSCNTDRFSLLPDDYEDFGTDVIVNALSNSSDFEVITEYGDGSVAYTFNISVIEVEGIFKFTAFSYVDDVTSTDDFDITNEEVMFFMRDNIMYLGSTFTCDDLFTGNALTKCNNDMKDVQGPSHIGMSPVIEEVSTNRFKYTSKNNDSMQHAVYDITFIKDNDVLKASVISYQLANTYNTLVHATTLFNAYVLKYNDSYYTASGLCGDYFLDSTQCTTDFEAVKLNQMTLDSITKKVTGIFEAVVSFDDVNSTTLNITFSITTNQYGYYLFDAVINDDNGTVIVNPSGILETEIFAILDLINQGVDSDTIFSPSDDEACDVISSTNQSLITACENDNYIMAPYYEAEYNYEVTRNISANKFEVTGTLGEGMVRNIWEIEFIDDDGWKVLDISYEEENDYTLEDAIELAKSEISFFNGFNARYICYLTAKVLKYDNIACGNLLEEKTEQAFNYRYHSVTYDNDTGYYMFKYYIFGHEDLELVTRVVDLVQGRSGKVLNEISSSSEIIYDSANTISDAMRERFTLMFADYFDDTVTDEEVFNEYFKDGYDFDEFKRIRLDDQAVYSGATITTWGSTPSGRHEVIFNVTYTLNHLDASTSQRTKYGTIEFEDNKVMLFSLANVPYTLNYEEAVQLIDQLKDYEPDDTDRAIYCDEVLTTNSSYYSDCSGLIQEDFYDFFYIYDFARLDGNQFIHTNYKWDDIGSTLIVDTVTLMTLVVEDGQIKIDSMIPYIEPTETEVEDFVDEWTDILLDDSITDEGFCDIYNLGPDCETVRGEVQGNTTLVVDSIEEVVIDGEVKEQVTYIYTDSNNEEQELVVNIDVVPDGSGGFTYGEVSPEVEEPIDDDCDTICEECPVCPVGECSGLITNEVLLYEFYEMFLEDYNDTELTDQMIVDKYGFLLSSGIVTERTDVNSNGGFTLIGITVHYDSDNVFDFVELVYSLTYNSVLYVDTNYLLVYSDTATTFRFEETLFERVEGVALPEATSVFEQYLIDYLDTSMGNAAVSNKYFGIPDSTEVSSRFSFLLGGGTLELINVIDHDGLYEGVYKETLNGVTTVYSQSFSPYKDDSDNVLFEFISKDISQPVVTNTTTDEGILAIQSFMDDLSDEEMTLQDVCDMYFDGVSDCIDRLKFTNNLVFLNGVTTDETDDEVLYTLSIEIISSMSVRDILWELSIKSKSDGTFIVQEITPMVVSYDFEYGMYNILDLDEDEMVSLLVTHHDDFYDATILSNEFCSNQYVDFNDTDDYNSIIEYCVSQRDIVLSYGTTTDVLSIVFDKKYMVPFGYQYTFYAIENGVQSDTAPEGLYVVYYVVFISNEGDMAINLMTTEEVGPWDKDTIDTTLINPLIADYVDPTIITSEYCDGIGGSDEELIDCAVNRNRYLGNYTITDTYVEYNAINSLSGYGVTITFRLDMGNGFTESITLATKVYYATYLRIRLEDEYDSVTEEFYFTEVEKMLTDYFDVSVTDSYMTSNYFGVMYLNRQYDIINMENPVLVDVVIERFGYFGPSYYVIIEYGAVENRLLATAQIDYVNGSSGNYYFSCEYATLIQELYIS